MDSSIQNSQRSEFNYSNFYNDNDQKEDREIIFKPTDENSDVKNQRIVHANFAKPNNPNPQKNLLFRGRREKYLAHRKSKSSSGLVIELGTSPLAAELNSSNFGNNMFSNKNKNNKGNSSKRRRASGPSNYYFLRVGNTIVKI